MSKTHAHRIDDLSRRPRITADDVRALLGLIAFAALFIAITAVGAPQ